jgi:hypothetical protein
VGKKGAADLGALQRAVAEHYLPNRIAAVYDPGVDDGAAELPLLRGKQLVHGKAALYVCRDFACRAPITDPAAVAAELEAPPNGERPPTTIAIHLPGQATPEGTARYAAGIAETGSTELGTTGLRTGRLGFGSYRTHDRSPGHREALKRALRSGVNLIDTATNYIDGARAPATSRRWNAKSTEPPSRRW